MTSQVKYDIQALLLGFALIFLAGFISKYVARRAYRLASRSWGTLIWLLLMGVATFLMVVGGMMIWITLKHYSN
jgi:hypothetical protein